MPRFVLGTAGHVDHGKTALVRALTGVETDRLPEEKRRGISIELGFAPLDLGDALVGSVVDVPGHRRLVHAMIAGAVGIELVLLVVAADEGVMPQTREHVAICERLGLRRAVIAVTKIDRVDPELAELAAGEARALLGPAWEACVVHVSSVTGAGVAALRDALRGALTGGRPRAEAAHARLAVDRVFQVRGAGTVVTGTLVEGALTTLAPVALVGAGGVRASHVRGLHVHNARVDRIEAPARVAVNVASLGAEDVHRGDLLTTDLAAMPTEVIDIVVHGSTSPAPLLEEGGDDVGEKGAEVRRGGSWMMHAGTARAVARIDRVDVVDGARFARLRLDAKVALFAGDRVILRGSTDGPAGAPIASGAVLDVAPPRRRTRADRLGLLSAVNAGEGARALAALVAAEAPVDPSAIGRRFPPSLGLEAAAEAAVRGGGLVRLRGGAVIDRARLTSLAARARALVAQHLHDAPVARGMPLETLRAKLAEGAGSDAADEAILMARAPRGPGDDGMIAVEGDVVTVRALAGILDAGASERVRRVDAALAEAGVHGVTAFTASEAARCTPAEVVPLLARLVRERRAVHVGDLWFASGLVEALRARAVAHLASTKRMTVVEWKAVAGLPRKQAILLLEHFDRLGVTRRIGDARELSAP